MITVQNADLQNVVTTAGKYARERGLEEQP